MEQYLIPIGLLLNSALIAINRFRHLPHWLYLSGLIMGIGLVIAGTVLRK